VRAQSLLLALLLLAQARDPGRPVDSSGGRIVGRVFAADTNRPVSRAAVRLVRANERADLQTTATDDEGRFVLEDVPAGSYSVFASRPGTFAETAFGQSSPDAPARLISVKAGDAVQIEIGLLRGAIVSGRILDHAGEPLALAGVGLAPTEGPPAIPRPTMDRSLGTVTDDRGEYRLFGIRAGEYLLSAYAPRVLGDTRQFAPIYYPGVSDIAAATRIQLSPGQEISGADFTLRLVPQ